MRQALQLATAQPPTHPPLRLDFRGLRLNFRPTPPAIFGGCVSALSPPPAEFFYRGGYCQVSGVVRSPRPPDFFYRGGTDWLRGCRLRDFTALKRNPQPSINAVLN